MNTKIVQKNDINIAVVQSDELVITDVDSALDFMATIKYETDCDRIAVNKEAIAEDFFKLSTCLAGNILQKYVNYHLKLAIIGDFSHYTSKPLKDFIYECNKSNDVFFVPSIDEAVEMLSKAK